MKREGERGRSFFLCENGIDGGKSSTFSSFFLGASLLPPFVSPKKQLSLTIIHGKRAQPVFRERGPISLSLSPPARKWKRGREICPISLSSLPAAAPFFLPKKVFRKKCSLLPFPQTPRQSAAATLFFLDGDGGGER